MSFTTSIFIADSFKEDALTQRSSLSKLFFKQKGSIEFLPQPKKTKATTTLTYIKSLLQLRKPSSHDNLPLFTELTFQGNSKNNLKHSLTTVPLGKTPSFLSKPMLVAAAYQKHSLSGQSNLFKSKSHTSPTSIF